MLEPEIEIKYAGFWQRLAAFMIDSAICMLLMLVVWVILGIVGFVVISVLGISPSNALASVLVWVSSLLMILTYFPLFESSSLQASPGKMLMKIKVVDKDGNRVSYARALARSWAINISIYCLFIGIAMITWTRKKQGLHDIIANCLVVDSTKC